MRASEQLGAVARGADGGGGDDPDRVGACLAGKGREFADGVDGGGDAALAEAGAFVELGGEAEIEPLLGDDLDHARNGVFNDDDASGV